MHANKLAEIATLLVANWAMKTAMTSPNPPPSKNEQKQFLTTGSKKDPLLLSIKTFTSVYSICFNLFSILEVFAVVTGKLLWDYDLARPNAQWPSFPACVQRARSLGAEQTTISPERLVGFVLVVAGTLLRIECYRCLAKNFTYELSVKKDHKLVTDGPYKFVRHPAYLGGLSVIIGGVLMSLGRGSWWHVHALPKGGWWSGVGVAFAVLGLFFSLGGIQRTGVEDEVMRARFGDEWVRWSKNTPARLLPLIY